MTKAIWQYPEGGRTPDMAWVTDALSLPALSAAAGSRETRAVSAIRKNMSLGDEALRAISAKLGEHGVDFDVDRLFRAFEPEPAATHSHSGDVLFALDIPLALTMPPEDTARDRREMAAEATRLRHSIAELISASRGAAARLAVPVAAHPGQVDADILAQLSEITEYWGPLADRPALALCQRQPDGDHPIALHLLAHGAAAHDHLMTLIASDKRTAR